MEALCVVTQTNCHYALDAIPRSKSAFMEQMISNDNYLILDPLEHSLLLWHRRLGHASLRTIRQAVKTSRGIKLTIPSQIKKLPFCEACALGKSQKTISRNPQEWVSRPGQKLHFDLAGQITPIGIGKVRWFLVIADDYCHWRKVEILKEKGEAFHNMVNWAEAQWDIKTQAVRLDGGREFGFTSLERWGAKHGTAIETTAPYNPHQNGVAERSIGLICQMARTMILD